MVIIGNAVWGELIIITAKIHGPLQSDPLGLFSVRKSGYIKRTWKNIIHSTMIMNE